MSTGIELTKNVVHATFLIFDEDGDGKLTYNEFIAIMKDRLHRGLHVNFLLQSNNKFKSALVNTAESTSVWMEGVQGLRSPEDETHYLNFPRNFSYTFKISFALFKWFD